MDRIMQIKRATVAFPAIAVILFALFPVFFPGQLYYLTIISLMGIYTIANSGLDIIYGYSGQFSLGQAGFYAIGAYGSAILSSTYHIPVLLSMVLAAVLTAVVGMILAASSVKLVHHFLALVTIGFAEIVRLALQNGGALTGGYNGILGIPGLVIGPLDLSRTSNYFYFVLFSVVVFLVLKNNLIRSRIGRTLIAIKENPMASSAFGIDVPRYKMYAFSIGAFYTGFAGALYAHLVKYVSPEGFNYDLSVMFVIMVLLGGAGSLYGPIIGTVLIQLISNYLQAFGSMQMVIYSIFVIILVFFLPNGIVGTWKQLLENQRAKKELTGGMKT